MQVKIAVFGRKDTIKRIKQLTADNDNIEILPLVYSKIEETEELLEQVFKCDIYLFTEALSYSYVKEKIEKKRLPVIQVDFNPFSLVASFYQMNKDWKKPITRIAVDVLEEKHIDAVINELEFDRNNVQVFLHNPFDTPKPERLLSYYEQLWDEKKIDYVVTSLDEVREKLAERNIPASTIALPDLILTQAIEDAISLVKLAQSQNNQIVTGYVTVKGLDEDTDPDNKYTTETLVKLSRIINRFATRTDATLFQTQDNKIIIIGTDKILIHLRDHYREFPLLQEMKSKLKLPIHLGFGLGLNAKESAKNAAFALESCKRSEHSICYIANERQELIGPIGIKKEIDTSSLYQALIHDARLNNELSYNFIDFITERNNEPFSTNDVAEFYQVTKRSAERTVNKLLTGEVIKISGEERPYTKGRPRKLFSLNQ